ncbi:hypothetical protein [Methylocystis sp.]|uniref:hypothetical protein n=1 Tax=Methylocystis sp. TaxID=1911079 RepID=UPI0025ECB360|nr:hypothetical protein [Methylocystis sp.]
MQSPPHDCKVAGPLERQLVDSDVVTSAPRPAPFVAQTPLDVDDVALDIAGACNMGCTYCFESDIGARRGPMDDSTLDLIFAALHKAS